MLFRSLMAGEALCQVYENLDRSLVSAGVILHDMEKLREIEANEMGLAEKYTFEGNMLGHLVLGVRELEKDMTELGFNEKKKNFSFFKLFLKPFFKTFISCFCQFFFI